MKYVVMPGLKNWSEKPRFLGFEKIFKNLNSSSFRFLVCCAI